MAETKKKLFTEFPAVTTEQWMEKVTADLKGADFSKKLMWRTNEGFSVKPMYRAEDIEGMKQTDSLPGQFPFIRGTKTDNNWKVRQTIEVECFKTANAKALGLLERGVTSFNFIIDRDDVKAENISILLEGIDLESVEVNFKTCAKASVSLVEIYAAYVAEKGCDVMKVFGSINFDPIGREMARGKKMENMIDVYAAIFVASKTLPRFRVFAVNPVYFNNAGAYSYQELGFALAWGNELIAQLSDKGFELSLIAKKIKFNFGVGSNYFMEIAKFRAARMLWANIVAAYQPKCLFECPSNQPDGMCRCAAKMAIHAETSEWNMTIYDAHVNLLRTQTEAMSAALAGVDSIEVLPFDVTYKCADEFSERIARNQQLLLKEESHFDKVVDPASGSYYIENLTASIAEQAWNVVLKVEEMGGFLAAMNEGYVVSEVNKAGEARRAAVAARKETLLGTNQFPNFNESANQKLNEECCCSCGCESGKQQTLNFDRGASEFEALRLETERSGKRPKAFMLTIGSLAMRLARSQFSCNFFGCAGYQVIDNLGFSTIAEGVAAAKEKGADIIVLCSSDDEYAQFAPEAKALIENEILVVAGAPACADELKAQGITEFINVRSNVLETLKKYNTQLL
ncbi:MAG: methylmalonyl-CoA mutase small subunit [Bacteroidales bacterium]